MRCDITYDSIISVENLLAAWQEFVRGKRTRADVQLFQVHLLDNILMLHKELTQKTYRHGGYEAFNISDPKPRNIHKATVRDRLVHHAVYRQLYPYFHSQFIADSYSCQIEKGTHRALDRFATFARQVSRNNTKQCYVLKCDIRKFFATIDHQILFTILATYVSDVAIVWLLHQVVDSFAVVPGKGLPLGNLTSQLLVNVYMNEFDQWIKYEQRVVHYIRYADDYVLLSGNEQLLQELLLFLRVFLYDRLRLHLHPHKVSIQTLSSGIDFLGWVHFPTHRVLRTNTKRRMCRKLTNALPDSPTLKSYMGLLGHGNTYKLRTMLQNSQA